MGMPGSRICGYPLKLLGKEWERNCFCMRWNSRASAASNACGWKQIRMPLDFTKKWEWKRLVNERLRSKVSRAPCPLWRYGSKVKIPLQDVGSASACDFIRVKSICSDS